MQESLWDDLPVHIKDIEDNNSYKGSGQTKVCKDCGVEQPIENFDSQYFKKDGSKTHRGDCRSCTQFNQRIVRNLRECQRLSFMFISTAVCASQPS